MNNAVELYVDSEMTLGPGECKKAILGFRGVSKGPAQLRLIHRRDDGDPRRITCDIRQEAQ
jgi:hypothetical protein